MVDARGSSASRTRATLPSISAADAGIAANPNTCQILQGLLLQSHAGPETGMHDQLIAKIDQFGEPGDPFHIAVEKLPQCCDRLQLRLA